MADNNTWWQEDNRKYDKDSWHKKECEMCRGTGESSNDMGFNPNHKCSNCNGKGFI